MESEGTLVQVLLAGQRVRNGSSYDCSESRRGGRAGRRLRAGAGGRPPPPAAEQTKLAGRRLAPLCHKLA
jgi:hypothetical protein